MLLAFHLPTLNDVRGIVASFILISAWLLSPEIELKIFKSPEPLSNYFLFYLPVFIFQSFHYSLVFHNLWRLPQQSDASYWKNTMSCLTWTKNLFPFIIVISTEPKPLTRFQTPTHTYITMCVSILKRPKFCPLFAKPEGESLPPAAWVHLLPETRIQHWHDDCDSFCSCNPRWLHWWRFQFQDRCSLFCEKVLVLIENEWLRLSSFRLFRTQINPGPLYCWTRS